MLVLLLGREGRHRIRKHGKRTLNVLVDVADIKHHNRCEQRKYSECDGIIGFDDEGASHEYRSVDEASRETRIPKLHIRECLLEGCAYLGWTFDYGYADCAEDKG